MSETIVVEVDKVGVVTMKGDGPWSIRNSNGTFDIIDSNKRITPPDVEVSAFGGGGRKTQKNVTYSHLKYTKAIVEAANAKLEEQ